MIEDSIPRSPPTSICSIFKVKLFGAAVSYINDGKIPYIIGPRFA
jgi:hypothetical protein